MKKITICASCKDVYLNDVYVPNVRVVGGILLDVLDGSRTEITIGICSECHEFFRFQPEYLKRIEKKYMHMTEKTTEQTSV